MAAEVTREESERLGTRVDVLEREVEGENLVTRHILEQTRRNSDDLAAIKATLARHDQRFDSHDQRFDRLEREVRDLRTDLPKIVGDVVREVFRERDR